MERDSRAPKPAAAPAEGSDSAESPVALVAGGVRGLGLATARCLARDGWRVHVTWRSSEHSARELERDPEAGFTLHRADLSEPQAAAELVDAVLEREGHLDGLVHAVGPYREARLDELRPSEIAALFDANVLTAARLIDAARLSLRASAGAVVLFGCAGLAGLRAKRDSAAYAAAKSALLVLARSWAAEEAPHGVRVNVVSPGIVPHDDAHESAFDERLRARIPLGRAGRPEEVGEAVRWLMSDAASYVTGTDLAVGGGFQL